jgi:DNA-binding NarL/FixJ family response regulator
MDEEIHVAIVEDQRATREGLAMLLDGTPGFAPGGRYGRMEEALEGLEREAPDVVLVDLGLPGMSGLEGIRLLRRRAPALPILVLTVHADDDHVFEAVCAGASGYLLKDTPPSKLLDSLREVLRGGAPMSPGVARRVLEMFQRIAPPREEDYRLSPRELELVRLLAEGHSYKTAAARLGLSQHTIRFHIRNVYAKLHVHSKSEAVVKALRAGLVT